MINENIKLPQNVIDLTELLQKMDEKQQIWIDGFIKGVNSFNKLPDTQQLKKVN
jgi:hypothetical protein